MQDYGRPDDESTMVEFQKTEHPLAPNASTQGTSTSANTSLPQNRTSVLVAQMKSCKTFRKIMDRLKSEPYFEKLREKKFGEF